MKWSRFIAGRCSSLTISWVSLEMGDLFDGLEDRDLARAFTIFLKERFGVIAWSSPVSVREEPWPQIYYRVYTLEPLSVRSVIDSLGDLPAGVNYTYVGLNPDSYEGVMRFDGRSFYKVEDV